MTSIDNRHATHPAEYREMGLSALRERFVANDLFVLGEVRLMHSHEDRMVVGGARPLPGKVLQLALPDLLRAESFLQRRELAVVNIGGKGSVTVGSDGYELGHRDVLYIGKGSGEVSFSNDGDNPCFFLASAQAGSTFPTTLVRAEQADVTEAGETQTSNRRTIAKYIHPEGVQSAQLVLGITSLKEGSVWNSMPPHVHDRRTEMYLYFDLPEGERIFHFMGAPGDTRSFPVSNQELIASPSWSMHFGVGTSNYAFVWVMAGENQAFEDMDQITKAEI